MLSARAPVPFSACGRVESTFLVRKGAGEFGDQEGKSGRKESPRQDRKERGTRSTNWLWEGESNQGSVLIVVPRSSFRGHRESPNDSGLQKKTRCRSELDHDHSLSYSPTFFIPSLT
jgi:hypothetical protein